MTSRLAKLAETTGITASDAPLVANAKTLHFLLPDLVPPIDRTYTSRFFFGRMQPPGSAAEVFTRIYPPLAPLAKRHQIVVRKATGAYTCLGHAKALDNAIVGFVLNHPERFGGKPGQGSDGDQDSSQSAGERAIGIRQGAGLSTGDPVDPSRVPAFRMSTPT